MEANLNNGKRIPSIVFGTFDLDKSEAKQAVIDAIQVGYTHIDCAAKYGNESEIGNGLKQSIEMGIITRERLFITTKAWMSNYRNIRQACLHSLKRLKLTYIDQYLLHWPFTLKPDEDEQPVYIAGTAIFDKYPLHLVWAQMESLVDEGLVKSIGVSNWTIALLNDMLGFARILPVTNQFEINPYNQRKELVDFCLENKIIPFAYRLIFRPDDSFLFKLKKCVLDDPLISKLSEKYQKTPAQILQAWCLSRNCGYIVKSANRLRMAENFSSQYLKMSRPDLDQISSISYQGEYNGTFPAFGIHLFK